MKLLNASEMAEKLCIEAERLGLDNPTENMIADCLHDYEWNALMNPDEAWEHHGGRPNFKEIEEQGCVGSIELLERRTMTIEELVTESLIKNGYDGLFNPGECGCKIGDLFPCGEPGVNCEGGILQVGDDDHCENCEGTDKCDFHIGHGRHTNSGLDGKDSTPTDT